MNIYEFIIGVLILLCGILCLLIVLAKCDNIKQLDLQINIHDGIKFKSLFYKKQQKCRNERKMKSPQQTSCGFFNLQLIFFCYNIYTCGKYWQIRIIVVETACSIVSACVAVVGLIYTIYRDNKKKQYNLTILRTKNTSIYLIL